MIAYCWCHNQLLTAKASSSTPSTGLTDLNFPEYFPSSARSFQDIDQSYLCTDRWKLHCWFIFVYLASHECCNICKSWQKLNINFLWSRTWVFPSALPITRESLVESIRVGSAARQQQEQHKLHWAQPRCLNEKQHWPEKISQRANQIRFSRCLQITLS